MKFDEKNNAYNLIQERIDQILNKSTQKNNLFRIQVKNEKKYVKYLYK